MDGAFQRVPAPIHAVSVSSPGTHPLFRVHDPAAHTDMMIDEPGFFTTRCMTQTCVRAGLTSRSFGLTDRYRSEQVRWSSVLLHPESALYNNPVTVGDWKSTKEALNEFATLIPPPNHKDKGKARAGRRVPLLDGLVAALEVSCQERPKRMTR